MKCEQHLLLYHLALMDEDSRRIGDTVPSDEPVDHTDS